MPYHRRDNGPRRRYDNSRRRLKAELNKEKRELSKVHRPHAHGHRRDCIGIDRERTAWVYNEASDDWTCRYCGANKFHVPPGPRMYQPGGYRVVQTGVTHAIYAQMKRARELCGGMTVRRFIETSIEAFASAVIRRHQEAVNRSRRAQ